MPQKTKTESPITGEVVATADLTINTKGGSTTATLKKPIADLLQDVEGRLAAAAATFANGQTFVLLTRGAVTRDMPIRIRRVGGNRFAVELETAEHEEVDEVTAAFLRLKRDQFAKGTLRLAEPVTADQWRAETNERVAVAEAAAGRWPARRRPGRRVLERSRTR